MNPALHPILLPYASHFLLLHRVDDRTITLLQRTFPERFRHEHDAAALRLAEDADGSVLPAFESAGYLTPNSPLRPDEPRSWCVSEPMRQVLQQELLRYWDAHLTDPQLLHVHDRLADTIAVLAADTAAEEGLFGELAVQLRRAQSWAALEDLWFRVGMRMIVTQPIASFEAFAEIPEAVLAEFPGLRFAHTYVASTSIMQRLSQGPLDEDVNILVARLSLQVTELTAAIGPRWKQLGSADARINVGLNWMRHLRLRGDFDEALSVLDELYTHLGSVHAAKQPISDRNVAFLKLEQGILLFFLNRWAEAIEVLRDCTLLWQRPGYGDYVPAFAHALMALIYALIGAPGSATASLEKSHRVFGEVVDFNYISVLATTVESLLALDSLDTDAASTVIHRLDYLAPDSELWTIAVAVAQWADLLQGDPSRVMQRLSLLSSTAVGTHRLSPLAREMHAASRVSALQALGHLQRARAAAMRAPHGSGLLRAPLARMHLMAGQPELALHLVEASKLDEMPIGRERVCLQLIGAAAHLRLEEPGATDALLRPAARQLATIGSLLPLGMLPACDRELLLARLIGLSEWEAVAASVGVTAEEAARRVSALPEVFPDSGLLVDLSAREVRVLALLDAGTPQAEMAALLNVSLSTVKKQVASVYRKLGVSTKRQALALSYRLGLLGEQAS